MSAPAKFLFDLDFGAKPEVKPAPEPTVSLNELARARAEAEALGYRKGMDAAEAQARTEAERRSAEAVERIAMGLEALHQGLRGIEAKLEGEAVGVAIAVARKLAATLIERQPFGEIEALADECFRHLTGVPHVVVRVPDSIYEIARERIEPLARARGFEGRLVVLAEPELAPGDCRIEWADGGVKRDGAALDAAIAGLVNRYLAARQPAGGPEE